MARLHCSRKTQFRGNSQNDHFSSSAIDSSRHDYRRCGTRRSDVCRLLVLLPAEQEDSKMNRLCKPIAVAGLMLATGCASITQGTHDVVHVEVANCGETIQCTASNKKGSWEFDAPGSVRIKKSDDALRITCPDGDHTVTRSIMPTGDAMIWGNVVLGGVIGAGVDASTDANQQLPDSVTSHRQTCRGKALDNRQNESE